MNKKLKFTINSKIVTQSILLEHMQNFTQFYLNISFLHNCSNSLIINNNSYITLTMHTLIIYNNLYTRHGIHIIIKELLIN
jgi:hypothetical protein